MPVTSDGAKRMAAQAEILRAPSACSLLASATRCMSSFWRWATSVAFTVRMSRRRVRNSSMRSLTLVTWSATSRGYCCRSSPILYFSKPLEIWSSMPMSGRAALEVDHLPGEFVDAPRHARVAVEHLGLDLVDVVGESGDDRSVAVDDGVKDRVEHGLGAPREQLRRGFQARPHDGEVGRLGMPHRDHEVLPDEEVEFPELDLL